MRSALTLATIAATAVLANQLTPEKVEADIKTEELERVLWNFNKLARDNGGNRAFGTPGYKASSDFVLERVQKRFAKHFDVSLFYFNATFEQTREIWLKGPDGKNVEVISPFFNQATPVPGGTTGPLLYIPEDDALGTGCTASQWTGIDATGKIALIKRGNCNVYIKLEFAKAAGAKAAIIYNQTPPPFSSFTLTAEKAGTLVPAGLISLEAGTAWKNRLLAGEQIVVTLLVDSVFDTRESWNIFADTKEGDPNSLVVAGAHLDSVQAGAGINDDGSGSAALLEIAGSFKKYSGLKNKVRFAWWGAEESGLVGSNKYTASLTEAEADKIKYYFNYDMIGSPNPIYNIYRSNTSGPGAVRLHDILTSYGKPAAYGSFGTSSDYYGFLQRGIPASGIFTGAGAPTDPCYHLACDNIDNIHWEALTLNAKAAGRVLAEFALSLEGVPPRTKTTPVLRGRQIAAEFRKWKRLAEEPSHEKTCSHKGDSTI